MNNELKANGIRILHLCLVVFVIITPFICDFTPLLLLHSVVCASLLFHWLVQSDMCFLSLLESKFRGIERDKSFIHEIVAPVYNFSNRDEASRFTNTTTFILMFISLYRIDFTELKKIIKESIDLIIK